jgi:FkbM family methyltransferase
MNLIDAKSAYRSGAITKHQYINEMSKLHAALFDYADFIRDTDILRIEINDGLVLMISRATGIKMICNRQDKRTAPIETLNFGAYEPAELGLILRLVDPGRIVFDIGANVGWYAINLSRLVADVQVHAFEPIRSTFNYLRQNVEANKISNIRLYNFGFSNVEQKQAFYVPLDGSESASAVNINERSDVQKVWCDVKTLDNFIRENNLCVDFIKCDVEGAELFVLQGGLESISRCQPIIFAEMLRKWAAKFNYHPNEIIRLLQAMDYRCFIAKGAGLAQLDHMNEKTVETNFFFLHTIKHRNKIDLLVS